MARGHLQPVSVGGIEFDALVEEQKTYSSVIPVYPVESGFVVSDTIVLEPVSLQMVLYVSNTPVTWLHRHGSSVNRVNMICEQIERMWFEKKLVKIVTSEAVYKNMGIVSISIKKSKEIGYAREISLSVRQIRITRREAASIPEYILKSGDTMANAGFAIISPEASFGSDILGSGNSNGSGIGGGSQAKKGKSILYGVADGLNFI